MLVLIYVLSLIIFNPRSRELVTDIDNNNINRSKESGKY